MPGAAPLSVATSGRELGTANQKERGPGAPHTRDVGEFDTIDSGEPVETGGENVELLPDRRVIGIEFDGVAGLQVLDHQLHVKAP